MVDTLSDYEDGLAFFDNRKDEVALTPRVLEVEDLADWGNSLGLGQLAGTDTSDHYDRPETIEFFRVSSVCSTSFDSECTSPRCGEDTEPQGDLTNKGGDTFAKNFDFLWSSSVRSPPSAQEHVSRALEDFGVADPGITKKRKPKVYSNPKPANQCHVCARKVGLIPCGNVSNGSCLKATCIKCFDKHNFDLAAALDTQRDWICSHCTESCPPSARCHIYARSIHRRRLRNMAMKAAKLRG